MREGEKIELEWSVEGWQSGMPTSDPEHRGEGNKKILRFAQDDNVSKPCYPEQSEGSVRFGTERRIVDSTDGCSISTLYAQPQSLFKDSTLSVLVCWRCSCWRERITTFSTRPMPIILVSMLLPP